MLMIPYFTKRCLGSVLRFEPRVLALGFCRFETNTRQALSPAALAGGGDYGKVGIRRSAVLRGEVLGHYPHYN